MREVREDVSSGGDAGVANSMGSREEEAMTPLPHPQNLLQSPSGLVWEIYRFDLAEHLAESEWLMKEIEDALQEQEAEGVHAHTPSGDSEEVGQEVRGEGEAGEEEEAEG